MLVVFPVAFPLTVLTISEEYSGSLEADMSENHPTSSSVKWDVLLSLCVIHCWMQCAGRSKLRVASVVWEKPAWNQIASCTFTSTYCGTFMNVPWHMFPIPALVSPKTCDTVAEDACNISSRLSIDRTHDKWGILRQSWSRHVREPPNFFKCEVRSAPFLVCNPLLNAMWRAQQIGFASVVWERLAWNQIASCTFTSMYCGTFMNHPGIWFPSQQHWSVPRHVTLWQKILVTLTGTIPLTLFTTSAEYSGSLEADMSELKCEVSAPFLVCNPFLNAMCRAQQIAGCKCFMGKAALKPDHKLHIYRHILANIHEWPRHMIPIPAALDCPEACDSVAEDACNIASHLSIDRTHDKWGILRQSWSRHVREPPNFFMCEVRRAPFLVCNPFFDAICGAQQRAGRKCFMGKAALKPDHKLHLYKHVLANIHESPRHMIPIRAPLVCPKTCDSVAEDACNIASHLSIDRTHDKWGILRQSWSRHVREPPNFFQCEVRRAPFLVCNPFLDAVCGAQPRAGSKCIWKRLDWNQITSCTFTNTYRRTFMNHPGIWFPSQQHWFVPRHVTLRQKMLVTSPVTFPLTVLTTSEEYSGSLEVDMSENHPTSSSVKWEVLPFFCQRVSWMQPAGHSHRQVAIVYGKSSFETGSQTAYLQASTVEYSGITIAFDSYPSSIGLPLDMWHCGRRYL